MEPAIQPRAIELLAPAGSLDAGLAALQFGADAVYLGLKKFSARADAENFGLEELDSFVAYAHAQTPRRRVFAAVNTLVMEKELGEIIDALGALSEIGVDAVIVQDLGVARLVRQHFPELRLHASTQMAVHNRAGVETLRGLGFARATLARELTFDEVREIAGVPGIEVESFIHGALCYSYSGLCLFSSLLLGRSGNRGKCAYPCRDRWRVKSAGDGTPNGLGMPEDARNGFAFSMKDLAIPDWVRPLREIGVASLKIEGRKKSALYVATVVRFYRDLLDGKLDQEERPAREEELHAVFSRPWTPLYLHSHLDKEVADRDIVGHRGAPVGVVDSVARAGSAAFVRFRSSRALCLHDGLQIDLPGVSRPFGFPIKTLRIASSARGSKARQVVEAPAQAMVEVALPEHYPTVPTGAPVYCSSSQEVKARYRLQRPNLSGQRARVGITVRGVLEKRMLRLRARVADRAEIEASADLEGPFDQAKDSGRMTSSARGVFEKLGETRFSLSGFGWKNPEGRFVPLSRLNRARRILLEELEGKLRQAAAGRLEAARQAVEPQELEVVPARSDRLRWSLKVDRLSFLDRFEREDWDALDELIVEIDRDPWDGLAKGLDRIAGIIGRERLRLALPIITRQWDQRALLRKVERLCRSGFVRWQAANLSAWAFLEGTPGLDLAADWPLYARNHLAAEQLMAMGATGVTLSPEDGLASMRELLARVGDRAAVIVFQDAPLFVSESCPYANLLGRCPGPSACHFESMEMSSEHGSQALAINDHCRTVVINARPLCLIEKLDRLVEAGAKRVRADFVYRPYEPEKVQRMFRTIRAGQSPG
jgi:putative protease